MTILERLKTYPGFVYQIGPDCYFLGKWICRICTDLEISDCRAMYDICAAAGEAGNTALYFQKLRAYSDFALEVPCNPAKTEKDLTQLLESLTPSQTTSLENQLNQFSSQLNNN